MAFLFCLSAIFRLASQLPVLAESKRIHYLHTTIASSGCFRLSSYSPTLPKHSKMALDDYVRSPLGLFNVFAVVSLIL